MSSLKSKFDCVVLNGTVVTATDVGRYDIGIKNGKIHVLAPAHALANVPASRVIDAEGAYVTVWHLPIYGSTRNRFADL